MKAIQSILGSLSLLLAATTAFAQANLSRSGEIGFEKQVLRTDCLSEGSTVADINRDGKLDIIAGAYWFEAPNWVAHELAVPQHFPFDQGYTNAFLHFALDVNQDGWVDVIRIDHPGQAAVWHENPQNQSGHWKQHLIHDSFGNETPLFVDMDGDGRPDLVGNDPTRKEVIWLQAPKKKGDTAWKKFTISTVPDFATHQYTHGLGAEDLNGDGRRDVLINKGWWEAPAKLDGKWVFHEADFGEDCAQMYAMDVNGDGLLDVISSSAHNYGVWWHEQQLSESGAVHWIRHAIDGTISQTHSLALVDLNGDGHRDLVTGKRFFAHNGGDPGAHEPAALVWYEFTPGVAPFWKKHQIDGNSGVGLNFVVEDVNGDGLLDIVVSNKKGVQYLQQKAK